MSDATAAASDDLKAEWTTSTKATTLPLLLLNGAVALSDLAIASWWLIDGLGTLQALGAHVAAVIAFGAAAALIFPRRRIEVALHSALLVLLGPLSGLMLLVSDFGATPGRRRKSVARRHLAPPLLETDPAEAIYVAAKQNRRPRVDLGTPASFAEILKTGTPEAQHTAVAAIARNYRPEMLGSLRKALAAKTPSVRVQAAAVYGALRNRFEEEAAAHLASAEVPGDPSRLRDSIERVIASGFVDADMISALEARLDALQAHTKTERDRRIDTIISDKARLASDDDPLTAPPRLKRHACGGLG